MTKASKSPVTREVDSSYGPLAVTITNAGLQLRKKGTRTVYGPIPFAKLFALGAQLEADRRLAEKQKDRPVRVKRGLMSVGAR